MGLRDQSLKMRLLPLLVCTILATNTRTLFKTERAVKTRNICGRSHHNQTVQDTITLEKNETCIYRLVGRKRETIQFLNAHLSLDCDDGEMWIYTAKEYLGPFCQSHRRKRGVQSYGKDAGDMMGKTFRSDEVDVVFKNGGGMRFSFGFEFSFEFFPGIPTSGTTCSYKCIRESNVYYATAVNNVAATALWAQLTSSMYNFNQFYSKYQDQCSGFSPIRVSCNTLSWDKLTPEAMINQIQSVVTMQCEKCNSDGICSDWRELLAELSGMVSGGYQTTVPTCDEDECNGDNNCDENANCINECTRYSCVCKDGFEGDGYTCLKKCDGNQCSPNPCGNNAECHDLCEGFECVCLDGYHKDGQDTCVPDCDEDQCEAANGNPCPANSACVDLCVGFECKCDQSYSMQLGNCCDEDQCGEEHACPENSSCTNDCIGHTCTCDEGYHMVGEQCVPDCDINQCDYLGNSVNSKYWCPWRSTCVDKCDGYECPCDIPYTKQDGKCCDHDQCETSSSCPAHSTCTNECIGHTCKCVDGYHMESDECVPDCDEDQCLTDPCPSRSSCINKCDGYECQCNDSYSNAYQADLCCDENQCQAENACPAYSVCTDKCISHKCECIDGYHMENGKNGYRDAKCLPDCDADQCLDDPCPNKSTCLNKCDGYECKCDTAYSMQDDQCCELENQCSTKPCPENTHCVNNCIGYECECNAGYSMQNGNCCDKNQCDIGVYGGQACPPHSMCMDKCNGFDCICDTGYQMEDGACCDMDQCDADDACPANSMCINKCNGFDCVCDTGLTLVDDECCDENQCNISVYGVTACPANSMCTNKCQGFECTCDAGYHMDQGECVPDCDVDQCLSSKPCQKRAKCVDKCDGYECECVKPYTLNEGQCCDQNQCDAADACPANSECENLCLGHRCNCEEGYHKVNKGKQCEKDCDEDQCAANPYGVFICGANSTCTNKCQGYECGCLPGYIPDENALTGCKAEDPCLEVECDAYEECVDGTCYCEKGWYPDADTKVCTEKVNECITGAHHCDKYSSCNDTLESYTCECNENYKDVSPLMDGTECVHPYYTDTGMCNLKEYSSFTDKKFAAIAYKSAYAYQEAVEAWKTITAELTRLGKVAIASRLAECDDSAGIIGCMLIDYTKDDTACEWAHTLEAVVAAVQVKCNPDWDLRFMPYLQELRKATCEEPDDCSSGDHNCHAAAVCSPKKAVYGKKTSGFNCKCNAGYYGNGISCFVEVNECAIGAHKCAKHADCNDEYAGYDCKCTKGYVGNGYKCSIPVDECDNMTHDCDYHAKCIDLPNGYQCKCDVATGYHGNGKVCTGPADECLDGTHTCHADAICTNTYSGFTCACPEHWFGDGKKCWPPLTCPWTAGDALTEYESYGGDFDNGLCSLKYSKICTKNLYTQLIGAGVKFCNKNAAFQQFNIFMNEMFAFGKLYEKKYGIATSHLGDEEYNRYGAECRPENGAVPCNLINFHHISSGQDLFDRVEALFDHVFDMCTPTYRAKWESWLARYHEAVICKVNECATGEASCAAHATCVDLNYGYDCVCNKHFVGDGHTYCNPRDYCSDNTICPAYSDCVPLDITQGGFKCVCRAGFKNVGNGATPKCIPTDPCREDNGGCSPYAKCVSTIVGYEVNYSCKCHPGHFGDGFTCDIIDPCEQNNCDSNAKCVAFGHITSEADYNCKCNTGWEGNGFLCSEVTDPCESVQCAANAHQKMITNAYNFKTCLCVCDKDYIGDGYTTCKPIDPCLNNSCHANASCSPDAHTGYKCTCHTGYLGDGDYCYKTDPCKKCHSKASCVKPGDKCVCQTGFVGDGFFCRPPKKCSQKCPADTTCDDGKCVCNQKGYQYNKSSYKCDDVNECQTGHNNCHKNAICTDNLGGFKCSCRQGYFGDGISCQQGYGGQQGGQQGNDQQGQQQSQQDYNHYREDGDEGRNDGDSAQLATPTPNPNPSGTDIEIYTELKEGFCSVMGFNWENERVFMGKLKWSTHVVRNTMYVKELLAQFSTFGKASLTRGKPQCDAKKAGVVPCSILYFPHTEHRCQLIQRLERIFDEVKGFCNSSWLSLFQPKMDFLLQNNKYGKQRGACGKVHWL